MAKYELEQRAEAYKLYVSDSLFFIQHMFTNKETDEDFGNVFTTKFRDILRNYEEEKTEVKKPQESAEDIKNRMIEKSLKLSGTKL